MDFTVLGDGCDGGASRFPAGDESGPSGAPLQLHSLFFVFSSMTDKPSTVKNASMACAGRERDPWQRTWLL